MRSFVIFGMLSSISFSAFAQEPHRAEPSQDDSKQLQNINSKIRSEELERLQGFPKPVQQSDLSTYELASAHRERAVSAMEKTDGLWQSWLISICEGCGPERQQFNDVTGDEYAKKSGRDNRIWEVKNKNILTFILCPAQNQQNIAQWPSTFGTKASIRSGVIPIVETHSF